MADLQHIIDQLREAHDDIGRRIEELVAQRTPIEAALLALGVPKWQRVELEQRDAATLNAQFAVSNPVAKPVEPKAASKPKVATTHSEKMRAAAAVMVVCPECGIEMSKFGIGTHRAKKHGVAHATKSTPPPDPGLPEKRVPVAVPGSGAKILACSECDATFPHDKASELSRHTIGAHRRGPLAIERTPVAA